MGSKAPKAPSAASVSAAQTKSNKETAEFNAALNRINQSSPFGSINYNQSGTDPKTGAPIYSQSTTLSPEMQNLFDSQISTQQGISSAIGGALGRLPTDPFNPDINVDDVRKRSFDSQMAQLAPQFDRGWRELEGTMSDRGLPIGSEIWNNQLGEYNRAKDSSMLGAARTADLDASNEFQRQYGNQLTEYNLPLQQLSTLMGNSQAVQNPSFNSFAQSAAPGTDVAGNIWNKYQADVDRANSQQSGLMNGLLGLGKLGLGAATGGLSLGSMFLPQLGPGTGAFG
jgi:hypothetical protein